uniref:Uncharacterized protein n=1 Tax=Rhizophora mucronata TaxID=61149 RepID=A0A2P2LEF6_RHIMU
MYSCLIQVKTLLINAEVLNPEECPAKIANIQHIIMAINAVSKVFCRSCQPLKFLHGACFSLLKSTLFCKHEGLTLL